MTEDGTISLTGKDITVTGSNNLAINATPSEKEEVQARSISLPRR
jgi:hypothetical protein